GGRLGDVGGWRGEGGVGGVAASPVRVRSAVGHEQDRPLCDLAADARAATPTAAGALVVPDREELRAALERSRERLSHAFRARFVRSEEQLARLRTRLREAPTLLLERRRAALDRTGARLQALSPLATLARGD